MPESVRPSLEGSCGPAATDRVRIGAGDAEGVERLEAEFAGHAYDRHRHDDYAIGVTTRGVQCFWCRGQYRTSTAGRVIVLHPDESHDGHAGSDGGFAYRMIYVAPTLIGRAMDRQLAPGSALPFVAQVIVEDPVLAGSVQQAFADFPAAPEGLAFDQILVDLADGLLRHDRSLARRRVGAATARSLERARDLLDDGFRSSIGSAALEEVTGLDRFALARQFRARYGTSPYRYLTMRRLQAAKNLLRRGDALADIAAGVGFADQSHLTRHFKAAYGVTPGRYRALLRG